MSNANAGTLLQSVAPTFMNNFHEPFAGRFARDRLIKMNLSRHKRRLRALFGAGAMLFAQFAMAINACVDMQPAQAISTAAAMAEMSPPCHEADPGELNASVTSCQVGVWPSIDTQSMPVAALMPMLAYSIARQDIVPVTLSDQGYAQALLKRVTAPPAMVRNCCLQI